MKDIDSIFPRDMRVETRTDNFDIPCGYDVVGTRQGEPVSRRKIKNGEA